MYRHRHVRRWDYSEFSTCMSPCGIGIQTRDVTCIHEVTRGNGKTVPVPNYMCPQPPPADRRYCNVLDCPVKWNTGEWGKVYLHTHIHTYIGETHICMKIYQVRGKLFVTRLNLKTNHFPRSENRNGILRETLDA